MTKYEELGFKESEKGLCDDLKGQLYSTVASAAEHLEASLDYRIYSKRHITRDDPYFSGLVGSFSLGGLAGLYVSSVLDMPVEYRLAAMIASALASAKAYDSSLCWARDFFKETKKSLQRRQWDAEHAKSFQ